MNICVIWNVNDISESCIFVAFTMQIWSTIFFTWSVINAVLNSFERVWWVQRWLVVRYIHKFPKIIITDGCLLRKIFLFSRNVSGGDVLLCRGNVISMQSKRRQITCIWKLMFSYLRIPTDYGIDVSIETTPTYSL